MEGKMWTHYLFCPHVTSEMAEEADLWKGLLLDGSDRQGGGERLAMAGWNPTRFHVSTKSEPIIGNILSSGKVLVAHGMDILFHSCVKQFSNSNNQINMRKVL